MFLFYPKMSLNSLHPSTDQQLLLCFALLLQAQNFPFNKCFPSEIQSKPMELEQDSRVCVQKGISLNPVCIQSRLELNLGLDPDTSNFILNANSSLGLL